MIIPSTSTEIPWYREWFDENYLLLYGHRDEREAGLQTALILETVQPDKSTPILDLACGEGRYTALLHNLGYYNTVGVDISQALIDSGRKKYPGLNLRTGDMRQIRGKFGLILSLFTSFGYFDTDEENRRLIESVYNALTPEGVFWLDFLNPAYVCSSLEAAADILVGPDISATVRRRIENGRIIKDICFKNDNREKYYRESVRLFTLEELKEMFSTSGFSSLKTFGDYYGGEWRKDSPRTILLGRKNE